MHLIGIIEWSSNYHNLMLSEADPAMAYFFLQGSKLCEAGQWGGTSLKSRRFPALLCSDSLGEFQGLLATGLGASRGFERQGTRVVGAP